jgi:hypothetical protein
VISSAWKVLGALMLISGALIGAYQHGLSVKNSEWESRWSERDALDAKARASNEAAARAKEQAYQHSIGKAIQDGQRKIDEITADAASERTARIRLQLTADRLATRIAASQSTSHSCTSAASSAASAAVMVLADVLKRADQRAGALAEFADQSHARGMTCEQSYSSLRDN